MNRTAITGQFRHPQPIKCYDEVRYRIVVQAKGAHVSCLEQENEEKSPINHQVSRGVHLLLC